MNIGTITSDSCIKYNLTGIMARSVGIKRDLRLSPLDVYSNYNSINLTSYFAVNGDCYDRYLLRMLEMGESLHIVNTCVNYLSKFEKNTNISTSLL